MRIALVGLVTLAAACHPRAHRPEVPRHHAVSLSIPATLTRTLSVSYERQLPLPLFSVVALSGARWGAAGDYSSRTLSSAVEGRFWLTGAPGLRPGLTRHMMGFFAGLRAGVARTSVKYDRENRDLASTRAVSETALVGYRAVFFRRLELTINHGVQMRHEFDRGSGLPPWTQFGFTTGATIGAMF